MATKRLMGIDQIVSTSGKIYDIGTLPTSGKIRRIVGVDQIVNSDTGYTIDINEVGYNPTNINGHGEASNYFSIGGMTNSSSGWSYSNSYATKNKTSYNSNSQGSSFGSLSREITFSSPASNGDYALIAGAVKKYNGSVETSVPSAVMSLTDGSQYSSGATPMVSDKYTCSRHTSNGVYMFFDYSGDANKTSFESSSIVTISGFADNSTTYRILNNNLCHSMGIASIDHMLYSTKNARFFTTANTDSHSNAGYINQDNITNTSADSNNSGMTTDGTDLFSHGHKPDATYRKFSTNSWSTKTFWGDFISFSSDTNVMYNPGFDSSGSYGIVCGGADLPLGWSALLRNNSQKKNWSDNSSDFGWASMADYRFSAGVASGG